MTTNSAQIQAGERTRKFKIEPIGAPVYSGEYIIGYEGGLPSYETVPESEVEAFLESYADCQDQYKVTEVPA